MKHKPKLPTGHKPIPIQQAMDYMPQKDWRALKRRIKNDPRWGFMIEGPKGNGNRYYVYPKMLRKYLELIYGC